MSIPLEIREQITRLNQELVSIKAEARRGLDQIGFYLSLFPENENLLQFFAYLRTVSFFVADSQRRIKLTEEKISSSNTPDELIQDAGEILEELLGRVVETKITVSGIINRLESLL